MNYIIKLLVALALFNVVCEGHREGSGFNINYSYSKYDNKNLNHFLVIRARQSSTDRLLRL